MFTTHNAFIQRSRVARGFVRALSDGRAAYIVGYDRVSTVSVADDLWMHLEGLGIERSGVGNRGGHPIFGRVEDKLKHMISKRCGLSGVRYMLCSGLICVKM
jgi:hypothetical protein